MTIQKHQFPANKSIIRSLLFTFTVLTVTSAWLLDRPQSLQVRATPPKNFLSKQSNAIIIPTDLGATHESSLPEAIPGKLIVSSTISKSEVSALCELIQDHTPIVLAKTADDVKDVQVPLFKLPPGVTGRVAVIELVSTTATTSIDEDSLMYWQVVLSQQIDEILYSQETNAIRQPILLSFDAAASTTTTLAPEADDDSCQELFLAKIQEQVEGYGLVDDVQNHHHAETQISTLQNNNDGIKFMPSLRYEVDGASVQDEHRDDLVWDTSSVVVFDELVSPDLRQRMLRVVIGDAKDWNDETDGPNPSRWTEAGLVDLPDNCEEDTSNENDDDSIVSYGLADEALEEICLDGPVPTAFEEFEKVLVNLFEDFVVTRLPEAVLGAGVTPLTANAPCYGQTFNDHIDADPFFAPPSPWTDVFGRYANRATGKPRFVSCLLYLNDVWNVEKWGAPTRFYDVATETAVDISPQPGRVVIMDQDVTHTVVAPSEAAGKRPRYSLVWKLVLHPKTHNQDMRQLTGTHQPWPEAINVGSAKR